MAPLDQRDRELLERYKLSLAPREDAVQANWEAIAELVANEPATRPRAHTLWVGVAVAAALVLGSWAGFHASERLRGDDDGYRVQSLDRAVRPNGAQPPTVVPVGPTEPEHAHAIMGVEPPLTPTPPSHELTTPIQPSPAPAPIVPTTSVEPKPNPPAVARGQRAAAPKSRSIESTDIHVELELLGRARTALESEDYARVLELVRRHDRDFPRGMLREETAMLRVSALCKVGPKARWVAARARFEREFPGSPLAAHLREDCAP
jgi:hypothetical protein